MKKLLSLLVVFCSFFLWAEDITPLPLNGDLKQVLDGIPLGWGCPPAPQLRYIKEGGPDGLPYVTFDENSTGGSMVQENMTLVPWEHYLLSVKVRTKGFKAKGFALIITDSGWYDSVGIRQVPEDTDWTTVETTFRCLNSKRLNGYALRCNVRDKKAGTLDIADIKLIPLSEKAKTGSRQPELPKNLTMPRMVPWSPALNTIPINNPLVQFRWFGLPENGAKLEDCTVRLNVEKSNFASPTVPLGIDKPFAIDLKGLAAGTHDAEIQVYDGTGDVVFKETFRIQLKDVPTADEVEKASKRLNNLCVEYVNGSIKANEVHNIPLEMDGWLYIAAIDPQMEKWEVRLDGEKLMDETIPWGERFVQIEAGRHTIKANCGMKLIVRRISETFACPVLTNAILPLYQSYEWSFFRKWAMRSLTTLCVYGYPKENQTMLDELSRTGHRIVKGFRATGLTTVDDIKERIKSAFEKDPNTGGCDADELFYEQPAMDIYTQGLKTADYDRNQILYTWVNGGPSIPARHTDFIATAQNASWGRGRILHEAYCCSTPTEQAARDFLKGRLSMAGSIAFYPDYVRRAGLILGNFNQLNVLSLDHHVECDYKYYLDMQFNILANEPSLKDLGVVGFWGCRYAEDDLYRWSFALLRHYVIEGKRGMLSDKYGFRYAPGHIVNGDFMNGLDGWKAIPAATDSIKQSRLGKFGDTDQVRYTCRANVGDNFCQFTAVEGKPNVLSQTAKNLVPGKQYTFLCSIGCLDDIENKVINNRRLGLDVTLDGATAQPCSFVWVDKRDKAYGGRNDLPRLNLVRIIFTAEKSDITVTFSDGAAKPGERLMLNFVQIKPYFPEELD